MHYLRRVAQLYRNDVKANMTLPIGGKDKLLGGVINFSFAHSVGHHTELSARMFLRVISTSDCDVDIGT